MYVIWVFTKISFQILATWFHFLEAANVNHFWSILLCMYLNICLFTCIFYTNGNMLSLPLCFLLLHLLPASPLSIIYWRASFIRTQNCLVKLYFDYFKLTEQLQSNTRNSFISSTLGFTIIDILICFYSLSPNTLIYAFFS